MKHTKRRIPRLLPKPVPKPYLIDPLAFVVALVGAPLAIGLVGAPLLLIPVFAVVFGGLPYLILGTPTLLWAFTRWGPRANISAALGFAGVALPLLGMYLVTLALTEPNYDLEGAIELGLFGLFFGPVWAGTCASFYHRLERKPYRCLNAL